MKQLNLTYVQCRFYFLLPRVVLFGGGLLCMIWVNCFINNTIRLIIDPFEKRFFAEPFNGGLPWDGSLEGLLGVLLIVFIILAYRIYKMIPYHHHILLRAFVMWLVIKYRKKILQFRESILKAQIMRLWLAKSRVDFLLDGDKYPVLPRDLVSLLLEYAHDP